jgi:GTPase SAR1 family protein
MDCSNPGQIYCYDVSNQESFDDLKNWFTQGKEYAKQGSIQDPVRILVANKVDLSPRVVSTEAGEVLRLACPLG